MFICLFLDIVVGCPFKNVPRYKKVNMEVCEIILTFQKVFLFFLTVLGLRCCVQAFSSWRRARATLRCGAWASHCGGFSCCRAQALGVRASVVEVRGLSSCGSRALERRLSSCGARA